MIRISLDKFRIRYDRLDPKRFDRAQPHASEGVITPSYADRYHGLSL